ncbi:MAG: phosphatidate cytidylyltransferase [Acidimicrobiales bacterium]|nr:phosphatidate cytidylyltransferase [Acidimicrobiales bacterium]MDP7508732.1 phosphatidate cytidylyltransferase [Acidimicrobiales bacterium]
MNQQRSSDQPFEEIRILGLEPADDEVEPGRSVFGGEPPTEDLPHWTEPPTTPVVVPPTGFASEQPRWADDVPEHHESQHPVGAFDEPTAAAFFEDPPSGLGSGESFDPPLLPPDDPQPVGAGQSSIPTPAESGSGRRRRSDRGGADSGGRDMPSAIITGLGLGALALVAFKVGASATLALSTAVLVLAAVEFYGSVRRVGYQPATLLGIVAVGSLNLGAYWRFEAAVPLALGLTVLFCLLWYLTGVDRDAPMVNISVTLFGVLYVGMLGSFVGLMLTDGNGIGLLLAAVLATVGYDVGGLFVGRLAGRTQLAAVSPNKTMEGLVGGMVACFAVCVLIVGRITPFADDLMSAAVLGIVAAVAAPLGDLCESMIKRDLGIKDMGSVLPGHGGLLDRFDALLFVLPATYYTARMLDLFGA